MLWACALEARFLIFDRVKREYLGERFGRDGHALDQENGWTASGLSRVWGRVSFDPSGFAAVVQREKSIFMRDLLFSGACPCERRV